ncbi:MAG: hypothetical protein LBJ80_05380 [Rickettsiales bacterium]|nr:hypothetical protein [Rickettsiales bacterium]MDR1261813.1 hypothetical protein [Rickettsiales bacterium]
MAIKGTIQLNEGKILLTIPLNQYQEFKEEYKEEYKDIGMDGNATQELYAYFTLDGKQLRVTTPFNPHEIVCGPQEEEMDVDSASSQPETAGIPISSVITQDNRRLNKMSAMVEELGLRDSKTEVAVELFNYHEIQNKELSAPNEDDVENLSIDNVPGVEQPSPYYSPPQSFPATGNGASLFENPSYFNGDTPASLNSSLSQYTTADSYHVGQSAPTEVDYAQQPPVFSLSQSFDPSLATPVTRNGEFSFGTPSYSNWNTPLAEKNVYSSMNSLHLNYSSPLQCTTADSHLMGQSAQRPQGDDDDSSIASSLDLNKEIEDDEQPEASYLLNEGNEQPNPPTLEDMTLPQLRQICQVLHKDCSSLHDQNQQLKQEKQKLIEELNSLQEEKKEAIDGFIEKQQKEIELLKELGGKNNQIKELNTQIKTLQQQLKTKVGEIAQLQQQPSNAKVTNLEKDLAAKNTEVQKLQKEKEALEAKKQPTEQSKAPTYTAAVGFGLAAGLAAFIALERTVRLDIWTMVGIALASALAVSGATYLALEPSTQVSEAKTQGVNDALAK